MANMDYVIVGPGPSLADVQEVVQAATGSVPAGPGVLHPDDARASLHITADPEVVGGTVVQVLYAGDPVTRRHELARSVYDELVKDTDWDLSLDSDDTEDVLAERIKSTT